MPDAYGGKRLMMAFDLFVAFPVLKLRRETLTFLLTMKIISVVIITRIFLFNFSTKIIINILPISLEYQGFETESTGTVDVWVYGEKQLLFDYICIFSQTEEV